MEEQRYSISDVADRNNVSSRTIQNTIKANPQLGVVMEPRKKTWLTFEQAAQISALLSQKNSQFAVSAKNNPQTAKDDNDKNSQFAVSAKIDSQFAEFNEKILELTKRAAKAEGRAEELEKQVDDLKMQREKAEAQIASLQTNNSKLLESSEAMEKRAEKAEAELAVEKKKSWWDKLLGR